LNDFLCGTQDAIAKGKVVERFDRTRRASSETEIIKETSKEWDNWYDKLCKGKVREFKMAVKDYVKGKDEERRRKV